MGLTEAGFKTTSPWAVCTHQERVSPDPPSLTDDPSHRGRRPPPRKSRTSSPSSPRRVTSLLSSVFLRDTHGVGKSHYLTGSKILRVLKSMGAAPELPEDLYFMIRKAVGMRKHLERNRKDKDGKFRLILIESRIHRLARYYREKGVVPPNFKYESATASALVA